MTVHVGEDGEKGEHFSTAGGNANLYSHFGNQKMFFIAEKKKKNIFKGFYLNSYETGQLRSIKITT